MKRQKLLEEKIRKTMIKTGLQKDIVMELPAGSYDMIVDHVLPGFILEEESKSVSDIKSKMKELAINNDLEQYNKLRINKQYLETIKKIHFLTLSVLLNEKSKFGYRFRMFIKTTKATLGDLFEEIIFIK